MFKRMIMAFFMLFAIGAQAQTAEKQTLQNYTFEDQFAQPVILSVSTQWLVFSHDKSGGDWVKQALNEMEFTDLEARGGIYVADISAMPSLITRMFALPKMREYSFRMALDREGKPTADWPRIDGTVTLMRLNNLEVVQLTQANSVEQIKAFLAAF